MSLPRKITVTPIDRQVCQPFRKPETRIIFPFSKVNKLQQKTIWYLFEAEHILYQEPIGIEPRDQNLLQHIPNPLFPEFQVLPSHHRRCYQIKPANINFIKEKSSSSGVSLCTNTEHVPSVIPKCQTTFHFDWRTNFHFSIEEFAWLRHLPK